MRVFILGSYVRAHCLGMQELPVPGQSACAQSLWIEHGGKGLNLAVGMHRLGVQVDLLLAVGNDAAGDAVLSYLSGEGLDTRWVIRVGEASGFGVGFVGAGGENFLAVYPGANALLDMNHVRQASESLAVADMVCAQFEIPDEPILVAFQIARKQGIRTLLNPSPWRVPDAALWAVTDILVVNESEAALLFGLSEPAGLTATDWLAGLPGWLDFCCWQGELLVLTLAEQGCVALYQGKLIYQPAYPVTASDATGAGDAFSAALVTALVQSASLTDALRWANASGAWVASRKGVLSILPTATELKEFAGM